MNEKKITRKFIEFGVVFIIVFIAQIFIDIYIENNAESLYKSYSTKLEYIVFILGGILIFLIMYKLTQICDDEIKQLNEKLKDESKLIWEKYHELTKYKRDEAINKTLEEFVINTPEILSIQIYQYNQFYQKNDVLFKINHRYSYIEEGNSINAIVQDYYYIKKNMYDRLVKAILKSDTKLLTKFINLNHNYLSRKDIAKIDLYDCTNYNLLYFAFQKFFQLTNSNEFVANMFDQNKELKLKQFKRGGILRGILAEDYYYFNNIKDAKKNRIYVTKCVSLNKTPHIVLFSFHNHLNISKERMDKLAIKYIEIISKFKD